MAEKFEAWGIVELMGHQRAAGRLSEESIGGGNLLRVDIPTDDNGAFRTAYYGNSSIYGLHVTDEATARKAAKAMGVRSPYAYMIESASPRLAAAGAFHDSFEDEVADDDDDREPEEIGDDGFPA